MARRTVVVLIDDLDGRDADETVVFALDGREWSIDLATEHATQLRTCLRPYVQAARKASSRRSRPGRTRRHSVSG